MIVIAYIGYDPMYNALKGHMNNAWIRPKKKSNMEVSVLPTPTAEMGAESSSIPSVTTFPNLRSSLENCSSNSFCFEKQAAAALKVDSQLLML